MGLHNGSFIFTNEKKLNSFFRHTVASEFLVAGKIEKSEENSVIYGKLSDQDLAQLVVVASGIYGGEHHPGVGEDEVEEDEVIDLQQGESGFWPFLFGMFFLVLALAIIFSR